MLLHILNGDSTFNIIQNLDIPGAFAVWREVMCEGPVAGDLHTDTFWEVRANFIADFFKSEPGVYKVKMLPELAKIRNATQYDEVILWFEYDLFCQINMLAALHFLHHLSNGPKKISLICIGDWPGQEQKATLGEIDPEQYYSLLSNRHALGASDLAFADQAWKIYSGQNAMELNNDRLFTHPAFPYLAEAIQWHKRRFPSRENGLNLMETSLLEHIQAGEKEERKLIGNNLSLFRDAGFGDLQHFAYLDHLKTLLDDQNGLHLNDRGLKILAGQEHFSSPSTYLGGAKSQSFYWDGEKICTAA